MFTFKLFFLIFTITENVDFIETFNNIFSIKPNEMWNKKLAI